MSQARTLVTSYCFPPYREATAVVSAKRVREFNEPVDVVCNAMDSILARDPSLTAICGDLVQRFAAVPSPTHFSNWPNIRSFVDLGYRTILRWQQERDPYERLYSRAQFAASHFLAARYKASHPDTTWVAEFSDPLSRNTLGEPRRNDLKDDVLSAMIRRTVEAQGFTVPDNLNVYQWCEAMVFALADEIIFTNRHQQDYMLNTCHDASLAERAELHSVIAPHPVLPREFYSLYPSTYQLPNDRINIGYFGRFYTNRGIGLVMSALRGLPEGVVNRLRLHIFTNDPDEITHLVAGTRIEQSIVAHPYLDYLEFLALADRMDLLLVTDATTPPGMVNPYLPSKWSDYRGSRTPVWAVVEEGSSLDEQSGIAYRTPIEHMSAIQQVLNGLAIDGVQADLTKATTS